MAEPLLHVDSLVKRFGGIVATDNLSLDIARGELHAIIGPNGAGKTTLISQLIGQLRPSAGTIRFAGEDITHLPAWKRSRLGLARSFQITSLLPDFTAADNVALAAQAKDGHSFRFFANARKEAALREAAHAALKRVGLGDRADVVVSRLSHGEQRELELAVALATKPQLLLLDEPMAGLGAHRIGAHGQAARGLAEGSDDRPGRARHECGVRARRPHHRAGLWAGDCLRCAGGDPQSTKRSSAPISATSMW